MASVLISPFLRAALRVSLVITLLLLLLQHLLTQECLLLFCLNSIHDRMLRLARSELVSSFIRRWGIGLKANR